LTKALISKGYKGINIFSNLLLIFNGLKWRTRRLSQITNLMQQGGKAQNWMGLRGGTL
jgi:hypothetical protein